MKMKEAAAVFEALSSDIRLAIFLLLVKNEAAGMVAGDIARALRISASNLSFHLKALAAEKLVSAEKEGRFLRYRAAMPRAHAAARFLTGEKGAPAQPAAPKRKKAAPAPLVLPKRRVW